MKFFLSILFCFVFCCSVFGQNSIDTLGVKFYNYFSQAGIFLLKGDMQNALSAYGMCLKVNPKSSVSNFQIAKIYFTQRDYYMAERYAKIAVENNSLNVWYKVFLADIYCNLGKYDDAEMVYKEILKQSPQQEYYDNLTEIYIFAKKYNKAIDNISLEQEKFGYDFDLAIKKSDLYKTIGNIDGAEKELIELKNFQPYNLSFLGLLCEFYMQTSQVDKVQPVLDEMLSLDPDNGLTFLTYALYCKINYKTDCFFDCLNKAFKSDLVSLQQKTVILHQLVLEDIDYSSEKLIPLFDILSEKYSDSLSVHNLYASYLMREQLYSQAGEELRKGLDCDKSDFNTWKKLFKLYTFTEEYEKLSEVSDMASEYYPEQIDVMIYSGVAAVYSGDYKAARDIFEQAMSFGAEVSESAYLYYFYLGVLDFKQNKKQDAYKNFDKFYQANHSDYNLVGQYANYLCEGKFNLDFAEKIIKQCVAFDGTDSYFYYVYANCMYMKNDLKSAQYFIEKSLSLGNTQKYYVYELAGDIFYKNKNCEKAVQNWNEALNLGGNVVKIDKKIKTCN